MTVAREPIVTIIIPAFNAERWLGASLASALAQSHRALEVIVVDDGSTDHTRDIVRAAAATDARVQMLAQENAGPAAARNLALSSARGEYIQYLDADDLLHPDKLRAQLARLRSLPPGTIATGAWGAFERDGEQPRATPDGLWADLEPIEFLLRCWIGGDILPINAFLVPREVCTAAGPWNTSYTVAEDAEYFTRLILKSAYIAFCPDALALVRVGHPSRSRSINREKLESEYRVLREIADRLLAVEDSPRTRRAVAANYDRFAYTRYPRVPSLVRDALERSRGLGGSTERPDGGRQFAFVARVLGWRGARWLQYSRGAIQALARGASAR